MPPIFPTFPVTSDTTPIVFCDMIPQFFLNSLPAACIVFPEPDANPPIFPVTSDTLFPRPPNTPTVPPMIPPILLIPPPSTGSTAPATAIARIASPICFSLSGFIVSSLSFRVPSMPPTFSHFPVASSKATFAPTSLSSILPIASVKPLNTVATDGITPAMVDMAAVNC